MPWDPPWHMCCHLDSHTNLPRLGFDQGCATCPLFAVPHAGASSTGLQAAAATAMDSLKDVTDLAEEDILAVVALLPLACLFLRND